MVFNTMKLEDISEGTSIGEEDFQEPNLGDILMLRGWGEEEEAAKDTKKNQSEIGETRRIWDLES